MPKKLVLLIQEVRIVLTRLSLIFIVSSCQSPLNDIIGDWEADGGKIILSINRDSISCKVGSFEFIEQTDYKYTIENNVINIKAKDTRISLSELSNDYKLLTLFKDYIKEDRIDEILILKKKGSNKPFELKKLYKQSIHLEDFEYGEFFIVYGNNPNNQITSEINIKNSFIFYIKDYPDPRRIALTERTFFLNGKKLQVLNSLGPIYTDVGIYKAASFPDDSLCVYIKGFNQEGRESFNKRYRLNEENNIEFFEIGFCNDMYANWKTNMGKN